MDGRVTTMGCTAFSKKRMTVRGALFAILSMFQADPQLIYAVRIGTRRWILGLGTGTLGWSTANHHLRTLAASKVIGARSI
jgi:hypothetical protein